MSTLQKPLKNPRTWLLLFFGLVVLGLLDSFRSPGDQVTAHIYVGMVHLYQAWGRPLLRGHVQCRYCPSCSEYSIEAVQRHGIRRGLVLTVSRLSSCRGTVPLGTSDPVPDD